MSWFKICNCKARVRKISGIKINETTTYRKSAIQSRRKCPMCGLDHDISVCPKEQEKQRQVALKRGNLLPSNDKSNKQGGHSNTSQSGGAQQSEHCYRCVSLGKPCFHSLMACWNKEEFKEKMSDPSKQASLLRRFANRSKSLADKKRGTEGDRKTDTQHAHNLLPRKSNIWYHKFLNPNQVHVVMNYNVPCASNDKFDTVV